jgi:TolB-like protein/DNA-binding winged helix-turn-helix (wHTH) protein/Flp pilus assembly protein TadD
MRSAKGIFEFGTFRLDAEERRLARGGDLICLRPKSFDFLVLLVANAGTLLEKGRLLSELWPDAVVEEANLAYNVSVLRKALEEAEPGCRYIETVPKVGYRFTAAVRKIGSRLPDNIAPTVSPEPAPPPEVPPVAGTRSVRVILLAAAGAAAALALFLRAGPFGSGRGSVPPPVSDRVLLAVLPFADLGNDADQEYFGEGLTEETIARIGAIDPNRLGVIARTSVMRFRGSREGIDRIGSELGVGYVLEGSVRRAADRVRITAMLIRVSDQTHLWAESFDRPLADVLAIQSEIASDVASALALTLLPASARTVREPPAVDPAAYDACLRGWHFWNRMTPEDLRRSVHYFQLAAGIAPNYARAYSGLAAAHAFRAYADFAPDADAYPKARAAALRALELDPGLAEAHACLGFVSFLHDWNWTAAERSLRRALELEPGSAFTRGIYATYLSAMGRHEEALEELQRAARLDPLDPVLRWKLAMLRWHLGQEEAAISDLQKITELDPDFAQGLARAAIPMIRGRWSEAASIREAASADPRSDAILGFLYAKAGRRPDARRILSELDRTSRQTTLPGIGRAGIHAALGEADEAFAILELAYRQKDDGLLDLNTSYRFEPLRDDPRYADLLQRMGLPE